MGQLRSIFFTLAEYNIPLLRILEGFCRIFDLCASGVDILPFFIYRVYRNFKDMMLFCRIFKHQNYFFFIISAFFCNFRRFLLDIYQNCSFCVQEFYSQNRRISAPAMLLMHVFFNFRHITSHTSFLKAIKMSAHNFPGGNKAKTALYIP